MSEWRQIKFNSTDFLPKEEDDCFLSPDDPVWQYTGAQKINSVPFPIQTKFDNTGSEKAKIMRDQNIRPGTKEWFKLWFENSK